MKICPHCAAENVDDASASCQKCFREFSSNSRVGGTPMDRSPSATATLHGRGDPAMLSRYADAYRVANALTTFGATVKVLAFIAGGLILLLGLGFQDMKAFVVSVVAACVVAIPLYVLGILVAAQGQILKATLDTAVNSSRLLSDGDVREILSVKA